MNKLLKVLLAAIVVSAGVNIWYFFLREKPSQVDPDKQRQEQLAKDPLFSDVKYVEDKPGKKGPKAKGSKGKKGEKGKKGKKGAKAKTEKKAVLPGKRWSRTTSGNKAEWQGTITTEGVKGEINLRATDDLLHRLEMRVGTEQPPEISEEEMIQGVKRVWLREVLVNLSHREGLSIADGAPEEGAELAEPQDVEFSGKAKSYIQFEADRIRVVADVSVSLIKQPGQPVVMGTFTIKRGEHEDLDGEKVFVRQIGEKNFAVLLHGAFVAGPKPAEVPKEPPAKEAKEKKKSKKSK